jgi:hypothetical protein
MKKIICAIICVITLSGCASLNEKGKRVRLTHVEDEVKNCLRIQEVSTLPPYLLPSDWKIKIRNAAGKVGADTVLADSFPLSPKVKAQAYKCQD